MEITAAVIKAIGAILAAILAAVITSYLERRKRKKLETQKEEELETQKEKFEAQTLESAKSLHDDLSKKFGWKAQKLTSKMTVLNGEGDARLVRCWRGVQASSGESRSRLPGYFWATPAGSLKAPPALSPPSGFDKKVDLKIEKMSDGRCEYYIDITGSLTDSDPPLDYDISWEREGCTLMTSEEVDEAYKNDDFKYDYFSFKVGPPPMEELVLEVNFPLDINAEFYAGVFDGDTEYQVDKEFQRTRSGFDRTPSGARFTIEHPLIGLRYFIYWIFND